MHPCEVNLVTRWTAEQCARARILEEGGRESRVSFVATVSRCGEDSIPCITRCYLTMDPDP